MKTLIEIKAILVDNGGHEMLSSEEACHVRTGQKTACIKALRERLNLSLADAKDVADCWFAEYRKGEFRHAQSSKLTP